jgi:hypothetical protein
MGIIFHTRSTPTFSKCASNDTVKAAEACGIRALQDCALLHNSTRRTSEEILTVENLANMDPGSTPEPHDIYLDDVRAKAETLFRIEGRGLQFRAAVKLNDEDCEYQLRMISTNQELFEVLEVMGSYNTSDVLGVLEIIVDSETRDV